MTTTAPPAGTGPAGTGPADAGSAGTGPADASLGAGPPAGAARPPGQAGPYLPAASRWRERRTMLAIIAFILIAGTVIALLQRGPKVTGFLSPAGTGPDGAHAIADLLAERGHDVAAVTTVPAAVAAAAPGTTLVVTSPYLLTRRQLAALAATRANLVIPEPTPAALAAVAPGLTLAGGGSVGVLLPGCALRAAMLAGPADLGGPGIRVPADRPGVAQCYIANGRPTLVQFSAGGRLVTILGTGVPLTNGYLARQGNAALAINLLSTGSRITWLVPPAVPAPAAAGGKPLTSLVPLPAYLVAIQLVLALALAALWRARRLGPLVAERLPVVVRASETVEGHARLYRSRQARDRVAATLRTAAVARLTPAIGLPAGAEPGTVTAALAARTGRDEPALADLLYGGTPRSDGDLVTLASDLDDLEGEVRRQ